MPGSDRPASEDAADLARSIVEAIGTRTRREVDGVSYVVEEVTWPVSANEDGSSAFACPHTAYTLVRDRAALLDPRHAYSDGNRSYRVVGDRLGGWMRFRIGSPGDRGYDLHLATDEELASFAAEFGTVAAAFGLPS